MFGLLTDELFEHILEQKADRLDELFLTGKISQEEYDRAYEELELLTKQHYSKQ